MQMGRALGRGSLGIGLALAVAIVVGLGLAAYRTNRRVAESADWQTRAFHIDNAVTGVMTAIHGALSHERGYLITGDERALEPYRREMGAARRHFATLSQLTAGDARQAARVAELDRLLTEHQAGIERTIGFRRQNDLARVTQLVQSGQVIRLGELERVAAAISEAEQAQLRHQEQQLRSHVDSGARLALAGSLASSVVLVIVFLLLLRALGRQRRLGAEMQRQSHLLQSILNSQADGVIVVDREGRFVHYNPAARRMLGDPHQGRGDGRGSWIRGEYSYRADGVTPFPPAEAPLARAMAGESSDDVGMVIKLPWRSEPLHLSLSARPLLDADGNTAGGVVAFRDVSERDRSAEALRLAKESAERATVLKGEFVANMSHELRTPLNGVVGMLELLMDTELSDEQRSFLRTARLAADSLMANVNEVLDFSKLEARKLQVESIDFSPRACIEDTLAAQALHAHRKQLELTSEVAAAVPQTASGDPTRLRQVINNLVSNAIKFTERGEVVVRADCTGQGTERRLQVSVSDTGIGIPAEMQPSIFQPFTQADGSTTRRFGGTGLGLTIAAELVRLMGGKMWLESAVGRGSTFHFTVALGEASGAETAPMAEPSSRLDGLDWQGLPALVVDDNESSRRTVAAMLTGWGFAVTSVDSAARALEVLGQGEPRFALQVIDVEMPGKSGLTLLRESRAQQAPGTAPIPALMLSASTSVGEEARCREAGAAACLFKPLRQSDLLNAVVAALPRPGHSRLSTSPVLSASPAGAEAGGGARVSLDILLVEDNEFNQAVAMQTLKRKGHTVTLARNGREALEMTGQKTYDIVLMDVQMPEMDGLEATRLIRQRERDSGSGAHLPILAMTARAMEGDAAACLAAGVDGYLSKPLRISAMWVEIERVRATARKAEVKVDAPGAPPDPPLDLAALLEETGGDRELLARLVAIFRAEAPPLMARLEQALADVDAGEVNQAAHAMKSMIGHWQRGRAFAAALRLEHIGRNGELPGALPEARRVYDDLRVALRVFESEFDRLLQVLEGERAMA